MNKDHLNVYANFLIASSKYAHSTDLQKITKDKYSKDKIYRFLSSGEFCEKNFWLTIKPMLKNIQNNNACISVDDTIIEKPHTKENDVVSYCYDHTKSKCVKGVNLLSVTYKTSEASLPINYRVIRKNKISTDHDTNKTKKKSALTKNQHFRNMLKTIKGNKIKYRYVLADSWFSSNENFKYIHNDLDKCFVFAVRSNRLFKFTGEDDSQYRKLSSFDFLPETAYAIEFKGVSFPLYLSKQVFKNEDGKEAVLHLVTNDEYLSYDNMVKIYQKRWDIEVYHKSLKQNCSLGKSSVRTVKTILGHIFCSIYAYILLEKLKLKKKKNQFKLSSMYYLKGLERTFKSLSFDLKSA